MSRDIEYTVKLNYMKAQAAARALYTDFSRMNTTFKSTISMNIVDNVSRKLKGIFSMLGGEGGFTRLFSFDSPNITNKIKKLGSSISSIFKSDDNKKWFEKTVGYFKSAEKWAVRLGDALVGAFSLGGAAITAGIAVASGFLAKQLIKINSEMEQFEVSLQTTLGSLTAAKQEMAGIVKFAKETPYQIKQITEAVVRLRAYSMDSDTWLKPLGDAASAFGRDITDAVEMAADAVMGLFRRAQSYGIKGELIQKMAKEQGITYADALLKILKERFEGGMELQAKTLKGIWSNIKDSLYITFQEVTKPFYGVIKKQIQDLYAFLGSNEGQNKIKQLVSVMTDMLSRMMSAAKSVFEYIKTNLVPIAQTTGKAMLQTFASISEMVQPILTALIPLVTAFTVILKLLSWIVTQSKIGLQIFVAFSAVVKIMNLLGFSVGKLATNMVATNKAATMLGATVKTLGTTLVVAAAAFTAMWAIGNYQEIKNNLKEIGVEIYNVAKGAEQVKDYLKEIGDETGHTLKEMTKLAIAAKEFGHNMPNVIEVASKATSEAQKGFGKNLEVDSDQAAEAIGRLAEAFIQEGDSFEQMKAKTEAAGDMLVNLNRMSEMTGVSFEDMSIAIESNRDVLAAYADDVGELTFLIAQFGKAAKEAGIEANVGQFLEAIGSLLKPTKEMLLTLPTDTWITKPLEELDLDALSKTLSDALDMSDVKEALSRTESTTVKLISASEVTRKNLEEGADYTYDKLKDAASLFASARTGGGGTGPGMSPGSPLGTGGRIQNAFGTKGGTIAVIVAAVIGAVTTTIVMNKIAKKINANIIVAQAREVSPATGRTATGQPLTSFQTRIDERMFTRALGKGFTTKIEAALELQTKKLTADYDTKIADIEKELKNIRQTYSEGQLSRLNKTGFGRVAQAVPEGMAADTFVNRFIRDFPEALKEMTAEELKIFDAWQDAFENKISELETKLSSTRTEAAEAINKMKTSYQELADAVTKGRVPATMRDLVTEIKELTKNLKFEAAVLGRFRRGAQQAKVTTTTAEGTKAAAQSIAKTRRVFGTMFLNLFDRVGWKMSVKFKDGLSARNMASTFRGWSRVLSDYIATETLTKARGRLFSLTVGPYEQRFFSKIKNMATGRFGIVPEEAQPGFMRPGAGEQWRPWVQKIIDLMQKGSRDVVTEIKTITPELAKSMATQFEGGKYYVQPHVLEQKLAEIAETGKIAKPLVASIDRLTGEMVLLDGHTSTLAAEIKGLKELQIVMDLGNWQEIIQDIVKQTGKVFPKITEVRLTNEGKLISALETLSRDARGRFVSGNRYQFTPETAPRITTTAKIEQAAMQQITANMTRATTALGEQMNLFPEKFATAVEGQLSMLPEEAFKIELPKAALPPEQLTMFGRAGEQMALFQDEVKVASNQLDLFSKTTEASAKQLSFEFDKVAKASKGATLAGAAKSPLNWILLVDTISSLGNEYLEPLLEEQAAQGKSINALAAWKTWEKIFGGAVGEAFHVAGGTYAALAMPEVTAAVLTAGPAVAQAAGDLGWAMGGGKMQEGIQMSDVQRGENWYDWQTWKSIGADLMFNLGRVSVDIGKAFKDFGTSIGSSAKSLVSRFGSLLTGGGGKLAKVDYSVTEAKWGEQGVEWEKAIEERFEKTKDVAEREAAYRELMEAKVQANVEALSQQREAVLSALTERIKAQYDTLAEAGKAAPEELINELARANEWVKNNISWGTEITQEMIDEFDAGGTMAGRAWAVAVDNAISAYDLTTPEGFKQLIEDVGDSQIAFELGVAALKKWEEESQALEKEIQSLNDQITALNTEITALESKLNRLGQVLTNVSSAFDLAIALNELELVGDKAQGLEIDIANLNAALSRSEMEMLPLQRALEGVEKEFDAIQDAIDKTQQKLDDFMNAPVEGEGAYREQRYQLERQIAQKEHALEAAQRGLQPFEDAGLTGSDTYKAAAVAVAALETEIAKLQNQLDDLDYARENITSPVEHAKDMAELAQQGAEQSAQAIIDGIKLESDKLALLQKQSEEKQKELDLAQGLVDKKQAEIDKTTKAIEQKTAELKIIQDQVAASNALVEAAKKRAEAEANIKDLKSKVLELDTSVLGVEGLISAQKLVQNAQDYAAGLLSKEQLEAMVAMYNTVAGQISDITGQKTLKEFDVADLTEKLSGKTGQQATLAQKIEDLTTTLQSMIGGINPEALSKQDLEDLFGSNVGSLISYMNANISNMRINIAALAKGKEGAATYQAGGIEMARERLAMLHGPEAIIPLQSGAVPVTLYGAGTQSDGASVVNNTTVEIGSIVVRDNEDLEEVKGAILALRQGQVNFFSRAAQYPERF